MTIAGLEDLFPTEQQMVLTKLEDFIRASNEKLFTLHGLAGVGKTFVLAELARRYPHAWICAPTGRAAAVLADKIGGGRQVYTIHQLIYTLIDITVDENNREIMRWANDKPFYGALVFLDECSMVGEKMARDLLERSGKLVSCGDPGQLQPVQDRPFFTKADATLTEIHRQAADSPIIQEAYRVRSTGVYQHRGPRFEIISELSDDALRADMILVPYNPTRLAAIQAKREKLLGITGHLRRGEQVMVLRNDHRRRLYNGQIYTVAEDRPPRAKSIRLQNGIEVKNAQVEMLDADYDNRDKSRLPFALAYAATVHKAQGSEWNHVLVYDIGGMSREWLYTAITRGSRRVTMLKVY